MGLKNNDVFVKPNSYIEKLRFLNFVCTSDSDVSKVKPEWLKKAKILRAIYLIIITLVVCASFTPLFLPVNNQDELIKSDKMLAVYLVVSIILIIDYALRWITYPIRVMGISRRPLLFFPFTGTSIVMLLSIFPTIVAAFSRFVDENSNFIKIINVLSIMKVFRLLLLLNIIPTFKLFNKVFEKQKRLLTNIFCFVFLMAILLSLLFYSVEGGTKLIPESEYLKLNPSAKPGSYIVVDGQVEVPINSQITNFWDALYFIFITITTIGYGDIVPQTTLGRVVIIFIAVLGIVVFSIPSGIIGGTFMLELQRKYKQLTADEWTSSKIPVIERVVNRLIRSRALSKNKNIIDDNKIHIILSDLKETNVNSVLITKLVETLGGQTNIEQISFDEKTQRLSIFLFDKRKVSEDFYVLINLFNIKTSHDNVETIEINDNAEKK